MSDSAPSPLAPCIVDVGTIIQKRDMCRLLSDLGRVRYQDIVDRTVRHQGEGYVMEVFEDPHAATLVANQTLYLNVCSFDYLSLNADPNPSPTQMVILDLVQDNRVLRLVPLSDPLSDRMQVMQETRALKAAVADAMAAGWDTPFLDEDDLRS